MSAKDRIYSDKHSQQDVNTRDLVAKNQSEIEQRHQLKLDLKDPEPVELTRMQRKMQRIAGSGKGASQLFIRGAIMGGAVGIGFGSLFGCFYAFQTKSFAVIPIAALGSGMSMAFFMGMGSVIRGGEI